MKKLSDDELINYIEKIETDTLLAYGVYQIEAGGLELFESVKGDRDSIMGLPIKQLIDYIKTAK
jgi:septum formation protein